MKNLFIVFSFLLSSQAFAISLSCQGTKIQLDETTLRMSTVRGRVINDGYATKIGFNSKNDRFVLATNETLSRDKTAYNDYVYSFKMSPELQAVECSVLK